MSQGVVVCVDPGAAEIGAQILETGGNAFDAAVAIAFAQTVVLPFSCGIGGFMSANLRRADGEHRIVDGCLRAGARVTDDMWVADYLGEAEFSGASLFADHRSALGYTSICTPGTMAALGTIHDRFCTMPWAQLLQPAIRSARAGYAVTPELSASFAGASTGPQLPDGLTRLRATDACARIFLVDGAFRAAGELIENPDYAATLERLAAAGADDFYRGELGAAIAADLEGNGAFVTAGDLRSYSAREYDPVWSTYRDLRIGSNDAPGAGPLLLQALNVCEELPLAGLPHSGVDHLALLGRTLQLVNQDRVDLLGDPDVSGRGPVEKLISKRRAAELRQLVLDSAGADLSPHQDSPDTTHLTVVDGDGNIAAITHSLGAFSGVVTPGLGFVYNNGMNRFDPRPGRASSLTPGKARLHLMMPAVALREERPAMVLGAPGGNVILSALVQSFVNVVEYGMSAVEAVYAPRIHAEGNRIWCEGRIRGDVCAALRERGFEVVRLPGSLGGNMARAQLVRIDDEGRLDGGSDPRAGCAVLYV